LPKIREEFEDKKLCCQSALEEVRDLALELAHKFRRDTKAFLKNHDSFCLLSLDCRGIQTFLCHSPSELYDVNKIFLKELGSTFKASVRKVGRRLSSYAQEIRSQHSNLDTRFARLGQRTFLLYTSKKCKSLPRARLSSLARVSDAIDWIPVELEPDPFTHPRPPRPKGHVNFDAYVFTDQGTFTTLEYLVREFQKTSVNLQKIEGMEQETAKLVHRLSTFAQYYSQFI
jgi:hypothetical protein